MIITTLRGPSPFEVIKQIHPSGAERWSARDLMPLMGYSSWRNFEVPIERAMKACENQGMDVARNFAGSRNISATKPQHDYLLTRFAAYLVAMNGDPNKAEVAAAQTYFAVRTREAEVQEARPLPQSFSEALRMLADECDAHEIAKARITELEPAAAAWDHMASSAGDWSVQQAAGRAGRPDVPARCARRSRRLPRQAHEARTGVPGGLPDLAAAAHCPLHQRGQLSHPSSFAARGERIPGAGTRGAGPTQKQVVGSERGH